MEGAASTVQVKLSPLPWSKNKATASDTKNIQKWYAAYGMSRLKYNRLYFAYAPFIHIIDQTYHQH